jgi:hypothetical protein
MMLVTQESDSKQRSLFVATVPSLLVGLAILLLNSHVDALLAYRDDD